MFRFALVTLVVVAVASSSVVHAGLSECDPLDPSLCALPFPNNFWLRQNTAGEMRLAFGQDTFPKDWAGVGIDPDAGGWNDLDGYPGLGAIVTYLGNVSLTNVPPYYNISRYAESDCPIVLLDTVTGQRVPVWGELDHSSDSDDGKNYGNATGAYPRMFMAWPASRLIGGRRYIMSLRNLVDAYTGAPIPSSYAFTALRDNIPTTNPDIELRRALFADIFSRLQSAGIDRSSLILAWDFTVGSDESITSKMTFIRDDAFARIEAAGGISYKVVERHDNYSSNAARYMTLELMIPQYVTSDWPGAVFVENAQGVPVYQGLSPVFMDIIIPYSVADQGTSGVTPSVLQYGHGLFGDRSELLAGYLQQEANEFGYVVIATDWIGLSEEDVPFVADMLMTNFTAFRMVPDRCQQGMLHALVAMKLMSQSNWLADPAMSFGNGPILTTDAQKYYNGNSQGGILGTMYMAVTTEVKRGVSGVGGGPYSLLLPRSSDFMILFDGLKLRYQQPLQRAVMFSILQLLWDRADPTGYVTHITSDPLPNTPTHEIVFQHGLGDAQVTYIGVGNLGRSAGASMFASNVHEPNENWFGYPILSDKSAGHTCLQQTWMWTTTPPVTEYNYPPSKTTDTHEGPRRQATAQQQMYVFFTTGNILNFCEGPCIGTPFQAADTTAAVERKLL